MIGKKHDLGRGMDGSIKIGRSILCLGALAIGSHLAGCVTQAPKRPLGVLYIPKTQADGSIELIVFGDPITGTQYIATEADRDALIAKAAGSVCEDGHTLLGPVDTSLGSGVLDSQIYNRYSVRLRCVSPEK